MALLAQMWPSSSPRADVSWSPLDDRWYTSDLAGMTAGNDTGLYLTAETIFRCSTVLAAVRFKAQAVALCTPQTFIHLPGGRRRADPTHYSQAVLRDPNVWQTGYEWTMLNVTWLSTWGNAYNRIIAGRRSFVEELRPLSPARTRVIDYRPDGSLVYEYRGDDGRPEILSGDEVLHYRELSLDGMSGLAIYQLIRNVAGIALLAERHVASFLRKGSRLAGLLVPTAPTKPDDRKTLRQTWNESFGGPDKTGTVGVLPFGVDFKPIASDNQKGQIVELSDKAVESALRFLGVPGVVVGYQGDKASTYASADAFFEKGGVKHCILPLVTNMEQRDEKTLLLKGDEHYIKRNIDVLQRANTKDRFESLTKATGGPFMTTNEARAIEDMDPDPNPESDVVRWPANQAPTTSDPPAGDPPTGKPKPKPAPPDDGGGDGGGAEGAKGAGASVGRRFAEDAAGRVVRREIAAIRGVKGSVGLAARYAKDPAGWRAEVADFYDQHVAHVADVMHVGLELARAYAVGQRDALLAGGVAVVETWEARVVPQLVALALGEEAHTAATSPAAAPPMQIHVHANIANHVPHGPAPVVRFEPKIAPSTATIEVKPADVRAEFHHHSTTNVEAPAPAPAPAGPQQIEIVGPITIGSIPPPAPTTTKVVETDKSGRIRATRTAPED
jgi:HK97 family phage portal protein